MRKYVIVAFLVLLGLVGSILVSSNIAERDRVRLLESRSVEFYDHSLNKKAEKLWDMVDEGLKKSKYVSIEEAKAEFIKYVERAFEQISVTGYTPPEIVWRTKRYAVTKSKIKLQIGIVEGVEECEQTAWVWRKANWYVIGASVPCDMVLTEEFLSNFVR